MLFRSNGYVYKKDEDQVVVENDGVYFIFEYFEGYKFESAEKLIKDFKLDIYNNVYRIEVSLSNYIDISDLSKNELSKKEFEEVLADFKTRKYSNDYKPSNTLLQQYIISSENDRRNIYYRDIDKTFTINLFKNLI